MNIWLFHHYAIQPTEAGITRHYTLLNELRKRGHNVVLIGADKHHRRTGRAQAQKGRPYRLDNAGDVPVLWLRTLTRSDRYVPRVLNMLAFSWRIFRKTGLEKLPPPDLVIGCTPDLFSASMVMRLAHQMKIPFVFHVGEIWPLMLTEVGGLPAWHPFVWLFGQLETRLYKNASAVVAAQQHTDWHIQEKCGILPSFFYIPNGADLGICPSRHEDDAEQDNEGTFRVMYAGAMGNANGLHEVIAAASYCTEKNIEFILMGDGPLRRSLAEEAKRMGSANIHFLPPVPRSQVYEKMRDADAFIINIPDKKPYRYGLAHNKLFDYMAMARPIVLATNTEENPVAEHRAGIVVSADAALEMAGAVEALARMSLADRQKMGKRARQAVENFYNFSCLGGGLEKALLQTLETNENKEPATRP